MFSLITCFWSIVWCLFSLWSVSIRKNAQGQCCCYRWLLKCSGSMLLLQWTSETAGFGRALLFILSEALWSLMSWIPWVKSKPFSWQQNVSEILVILKINKMADLSLTFNTKPHFTLVFSESNKTSQISSFSKDSICFKNVHLPTVYKIMFMTEVPVPFRRLRKS